jgi:HEAT repeat protein
VNDARVDASTAGSSSVDAYEEDWYRSLRALAERRRTELEQFDDEPDETPEAPLDEGAEPSTPSHVWATPPAHTPGDVRAVLPASEGGAAETAPTVSDTETDWSGNEDATRPFFVESPTADTAVDGADLVASETPEDAIAAAIDSSATVFETTADGGDGDIPDAVGRAEDPWARALKPLERIALTPSQDATHDVERPDVIAASWAEEGDTTPVAQETAVVEGVVDVEPAEMGQLSNAQAEAARPPAVYEADHQDHREPEWLHPGTAVDVEVGPPVEEGSHEGISASTKAAIEPGAGAERPPGSDAETEPEAPVSSAEAPAGPEPIHAEGAKAPDAGSPTEVERPDLPSLDIETAAGPDGAGPVADGEDVADVENEVASDNSEPDVAVDEGESELTSELADAERHDGADAAAEREGEGEGEPKLDPETEPTGPSLTSDDAGERRTALMELAERDPTSAEVYTVSTLILDPDAEIRRLAVETLSRTPARMDDAVVRQALQDPNDDVRAAAVRAAAARGIRDLPTLAPLVEARRSPRTHRTVLALLPKILGEAHLTTEAIDPLLLAVAQMQPPPDDSERGAMSEIAASIGSSLLIEGLTLPDARRLGAVRLLADDRSHVVLHALAERAGDPLEEVRQAGLAAAGEIARIEAEAARAAGPPDIGALAEDLRNPDPEHAERALTTLADVERSDVVTWCRERLGQGDPESVAMVASLAAVLDLNEIGVELLTRGASLPSERRRPVVEALTKFPDPSQLATFLAVVPSDRRADAVRLVWEASGRPVLPDLRNLLADPATEVRVAVIDIARDADDPASIEAVARLLATDASPDVRAAAVRAIAGAEGGLPNVIGALADTDPHVRATAVEWMPSSPAAEVGPVLAHALTDLDERVRLAAIERLAGVSSSEPALAWSALRQCRIEERDELLDAFQRTNQSLILEIALEHLYSPDQEERTLAVEMTGWGASQAAVESAIRALGDPVPEVRRAAVGALGRLRDRSAVAALGKTLADPDADVRVGAVRALGVIDDEGVLAFLVAALKDPDHRVRETTSHVLTEWSSPAVAKRLAGVLAVPSLRDSAADLLRRIGPTSVELLIDVLIQGSAEIRSTVGPLLDQIVGIDEFLGRMDSLEPERRLRAIEALGAIAGPPAVEALTRSLSDPDERIRLRATQWLGELGDPLAAEAVRRLVDDPVPEVAAAARQALEGSLDSRGADRDDS